MDYNKIIKNGLLNGIRTFCSILFPLITIPYVTRVLSVESIGIYNFANSIISYFILFASLGINTYAVRECSKVANNRELLEKKASQILSFNICSMIISYFILFILLLIVPSIVKYPKLILLLSINIILPILGTEWLNTAREDFAFITYRTILFQVIALVCTFVFVRNSDDYINYAFINVIATSGASLVNIFYIRKSCKLTFTSNINFRKHLKPVILLFSLLIAQNILSNLDITMISIIKDDFQTGLYSMSVRIYTTIERVISSIALVLLPQLSVLFNENKYEELNIVLHRVFNFIYTTAVPLTVGLIVLSKEILVFVCGKEYEQAALSLSILSISMLINLLGGSFWGNIILLPSGREGLFMIACIVSAIINAILNYYCISTFGIAGAATATCISATVIYFICKYKKNKQICLNYELKEIICPIIGGICITAICLISKQLFASYLIRIMFSVFLSSIVYYSILIIFKNDIIKLINSKLIRRKGK